MASPTSDPSEPVRRRLLAVSLGWVGISVVAEGIPALLLPHQLLAAGERDATGLGMVTLVTIALAALIQPLAGRWSDAVGRWPIVWVGAATAVGGLGLMLIPGLVVPAAVVAIVGVSVAQAGHQPLLPDLVVPAQRGRGAGLKGVFDVGGAFVGFLVLGAFLGAGSAVPAVVVLAMLLVVPFAVARRLIGSPARVGAEAEQAVDGGLAALMASRFLFLLGVYVVGRFMLFFVADRLGLGADEAAAATGLLLALLALGSAVAALPAGWLADRLGRRRLMLGGGLAAGAGMGLMPLADSLAMLGVLGLLIAVGSAAFSAGNWAALADRTTTGQVGWQLGVANLATAGAVALAGAFGIVIDHWGFAVAFGLASASAVAGGILAWRDAGTAGAATDLRPAEVTG